MPFFWRGIHLGHNDSNMLSLGKRKIRQNQLSTPDDRIVDMVHEHIVRRAEPMAKRG